MSQAFVRESDEQWLHEVPPTMNALLVYLSRGTTASGCMSKAVVFIQKPAVKFII